MPDVYVSYSENGKGVLKSPRIDQTFATPHEAERAGVEFSQKWIDDGNQINDTPRIERRFSPQYVETHTASLQKEKGEAKALPLFQMGRLG